VTRRIAGLLALGSATCGVPAIAPIELDLSNNCAAVEVVALVDGLQSPTTAWTTVFAAMADRPGHPAAWILAAHDIGGTPSIGLFHIDETGMVDHQFDVQLPPAAAPSLGLVHGSSPGSVFLTERGPQRLQVARFEALAVDPFEAISQNLAAIAVPCDPDGDEIFTVCDASDWRHELVLIGGEPFALTYPPSSPDFTVEITPTELDLSLSPSPGEGRTMDFRPECNPELTPDDYTACEALFAERTYPTLAPAGMAGSQRGELLVLSMYREVKQGDDPITVADAPLFLVFMNDLARPTGLLRVDPSLPEPRNVAPRGVALDANASYLHYTATDGSPVLVRAGHSAAVFERLDDRLDLPDDATLVQLDDDVAMHRVVDGAWEILKLFPDAIEQSQTLVHEADAAIEAVEPAGPGTFLLRKRDGEADLVHLRCDLDPEP
jgi:hypothetical protein